MCWLIWHWRACGDARSWLAVLRLTTGQLRQIEQNAEKAYPEEGCGLVVGRTDGQGVHIVDEVVPSANVAREDRTRNFEIDPELRFRTEKRLRGDERAIIGHFHSHPNGHAQPSKKDAAMVFEPEMIWLITAVESGHATETAAFLFDEEGGAFVESKVELSDRAE